MPVQQEVTAFGKLMRFFYQIMVGLGWVYEHIVRPLTKPIRAVFGWIFAKYRALWDRFVYLKTGHFSRTRAGLMITATVGALYVIPAVLGFMGDLGLFLATVDRETVYLTQSQEIYPEDDVHSVKGCETLPCNDQSSIYYRVSPSDFNQVWSMIMHWNVFFPDDIAAAVPPGLNKCEVLSYGIRVKLYGLRTLLRRVDIYPDILEVSCVPVTESK